MHRKSWKRRRRVCCVCVFVCVCVYVVCVCVCMLCVCVCVCVRERERERDIIEESFTNYRSRRCWINFKDDSDLKAFVCEIYNRRKKRWVLLYSL